jgi:FlgD Ig-like domain/Cohesin domain
VMMQRSGLAAAALVALIAFAGMIAPTVASAGCINVYVPETTAVTPGEEITIPVRVSDVAQGMWPIYSYELEIEYCTGQDAILTFLGATNGPIADGAGWQTVTYFETSPGRIKFANAGSVPLEGDGVLLYLNFRVSAAADPCEVCDINILGMNANDASQAVEFCTDDGQVYVDSDSCTGNIIYREGQRPIPGVKVRLYAALDGAAFQRTTWTDAQGDYHFNCLPKGLTDQRVVVSKSYDQDTESTVGTLDASIILRETVMDPGVASYFRNLDLCGVNPDDEAADTSGDDNVSAYDASLLLQFMVGARAHVPAWDGQDWIFCPDDEAGVWNEGACGTNFTGLLIGDVDRNWGTQSLAKGISGSVEIHLAAATTADDGSILLPIELGSGAAVSNGMLNLRLPAGVDLLGASSSADAQGVLVAANQDGRTVRVAFASARNVANGSALVNLRLRSSRGDADGAELVNAEFEGGQVAGTIGLTVQGNQPSARGLQLLGNRPNPFNPQTSIRFYLPESVDTSVYIYDQSGRRVRTLVDNTAMAGEIDLVWNGTNDDGKPVSSGVYYYQVKAGSWSSSAKMTLVK